MHLISNPMHRISNMVMGILANTRSVKILIMPYYMSGASNLGYGKEAPFSNVNDQFVNATSSNYAGNFSDNTVLRGGLRRRIKRVTRRYKKSRRGGSNTFKWFKRHFKRTRGTGRRHTGRRHTGRRHTGRRHTGRRHTGRRRRSHSMRGGYSQYMNNMPSSASYQVAGIQLPASQLALANPVPFTKLGNEAASCVDNYNHYTNTGFPSAGH